MKTLLKVVVLMGLILSVSIAWEPAAAYAHGGGGMGHSGAGMSSGMHHGGYVNPWWLYPLPSQQKRKPTYPLGPIGLFR